MFSLPIILFSFELRIRKHYIVKVVFVTDYYLSIINYTHFSTTNHITASAHEQCCHLVNNYNNAYFKSSSYQCDQIDLD